MFMSLVNIIDNDYGNKNVICALVTMAWHLLELWLSAGASNM